MATPGPLWCSTCGRPLEHQGEPPQRRLEDWYGVRLQLRERTFILGVSAAANAVTAVLVFVLRP